MLIEGCSTIEARLLGVQPPAKFFAELELEHSHIFLIELGSDALYIFDNGTYRWLRSTDCSVEENNGEASHIL